MRFAMDDETPEPQVSIHDQVKCVKRELALRQACYPRWVKSGKMKQPEADRELQAMQAVLDTLKRIEPPF